MLTQEQIKILLKRWYRDWNTHNLDKVMVLFHNDIVYVHWNGKTIIGKRNLKRVWKPWFEKHNDFSFTEIETLIDANQQKALFRWTLDWVPPESSNANIWLREKRAGVDVLHFYEKKIIKKLTFSRVIDSVHLNEVDNT